MTETSVLSALVLQTQITKLALWPGFTCEEAEKDWTRTHSCGVLRAGAEEVGVGVGVGVGEPDVGLGVGLGLEPEDPFLLGDGLGLLGLDDELAEGESDADSLGLVDGVALADELAETDALGDADLDDRAELVGEAEPLPDGDVLAEDEEPADDVALADEDEVELARWRARLRCSAVPFFGDDVV